MQCHLIWGFANKSDSNIYICMTYMIYINSIANFDINNKLNQPLIILTNGDIENK